MCVTADEPKPVRVADITYLRPSTLDDLWRDADLVARVRVVETSMKAKEPSRGIKTPLVHTEAKLEVMEQYRGKRTDAGADAVLSLRSGQGDWSSRTRSLTTNSLPTCVSAPASNVIEATP